ncbi:hypothetical protein FE257_006170 [Aspergillus nanangensis]|uniref:Uncharacterized protein n=1 Tax=Aspergillus nanangensis TaxID=2582783 RepID=A0AAD4CPV1_ASPNN|nr:hypothetical protein FE257_006170 [Aspergillus nanangensis]
MYNDLVATDSTLLFGELLPIIRIMIVQLVRRRFIHQLITPVLVISVQGLKTRVIEAYFDGQELVVRRSKLYDFTHGNNEAFKVFAEWYMGKPRGITDTAPVPES